MPNTLSLWLSACARAGRAQGAEFAARRPGRTAHAALLGLIGSLALAGFAAPPSARAVLIATGDGSGNTTAPTADPGFANVGVVNGLSGVYLRNGWVLTAGHVGEGAITLGGITYPAVPGSFVRFVNPDQTLADLAAFKLQTRPPRPDLTLADTAPTSNTLITVIGNGLGRGTPTNYMGIDGWNWTGSTAIRWGTNRITQVNEYQLFTQAFRIVFDDYRNPPPGQHEADIVVGDSGGGAFTGSGASARLIGILYAHATYAGQPLNTSIFGNAGLIADLHAYRDDILALTGQADCADGLDDDGDGLVDYPIDPGCSASNDASERTTAYQCDNGLDDDGDLATDYPADAGCLHPSNPIEAPEPGLVAGLLAGASALAERRRRVAAQASSTRSTR